VLLLSAAIGVSSLTTGCGLVGHESCSPAPLTVSPAVLHPGGTAVVRSKGYPCHVGSVGGHEAAILEVVNADDKQDQATVGSGLVGKNGSFEFVIHIPDRVGNLLLTGVAQKAYIIASGATLPPCPKNAKCPLYEIQLAIAPP